jgi:hypothetical protein
MRLGRIPEDPLLRLERFIERIPFSGCWVWLAALNKHGYGSFKYAGKDKKAHRVSYELFIGPIPYGLTLDHLCRVRCCVNPAHLEPTTIQENWRRGVSPLVNYSSMTHCVHGHLFAGDNLIVRVRKGRTSRICRQCCLFRNKKYRDAKFGISGDRTAEQELRWENRLLNIREGRE